MNTLNESDATNELLASLGGLPEQSKTPKKDSTFEQSKPSSGASGITSSVEEKALKLLGSGIQAEQVAAALGVTPSRIAQLLSEEYFASKVADLRYETLQSHNKRDGAYDELEDRLLVKLEKSLPLMIKPESILKAISIVNGAKRRGQSAPAQTTNQQNVVNLVLPTIMVDKFAVDMNNQVIKAGDQSLLTMPSGNLLKQVEDAEASKLDYKEEEAQ